MFNQQCHLLSGKCKILKSLKVLLNKMKKYSINIQLGFTMKNIMYKEFQLSNHV